MVLLPEISLIAFLGADEGLRLKEKPKERKIDEDLEAAPTNQQLDEVNLITSQQLEEDSSLIPTTEPVDLSLMSGCQVKITMEKRGGGNKITKDSFN